MEYTSYLGKLELNPWKQGLALKESGLALALAGSSDKYDENELSFMVILVLKEYADLCSLCPRHLIFLSVRAFRAEAGGQQMWAVWGQGRPNSQKVPLPLSVESSLRDSPSLLGGTN